MLIIANLLLVLERRELLDPADTDEIFDRALDAATGEALSAVSVAANLTNALRSRGEGSGEE